MKALVIAAVLLAAAAPRAHAEDLVAYPEEGDADAADPEAARVQALDQAFGKAASAALAEIVDAPTRKANQAALDREIVAHARLWVARFSVTKDETVDGRRQLSVSVRIDRDKLRARLAELSISTQAGGDLPADQLRSALVLLRVTRDGAPPTQSWGRDATVGPLARLLAQKANATAAKPPKAGPDARDGELPVDDAAAESAGADAKAEVVVIAGVTVGAQVPIRGVLASGKLVTAHVRALDRTTHQAIGQGTGIAVATTDEEPALERAVSDACADAFASGAVKLVAAQAGAISDTPVGEPGVVLVRAPRGTPWATIEAELKYLAGARGVSRAEVRHLSPAGWILGVTTTDSLERVAAIAKQSPAAEINVSAKVSGDIVDLTFGGAP
ncbi:MAG TPA: hypothetical protein VGM88_24710 [Kofleriaceae bacterium]